MEKLLTVSVAAYNGAATLQKALEKKYLMPLPDDKEETEI